MANLDQFRGMINDLRSDKLSEICEQFLFDHEGAMRILSDCCSDFGLNIDDVEIKNHMSNMHSSGDFDNVICFGIELSDNQLYKKFHPD